MGKNHRQNIGNMRLGLIEEIKNKICGISGFFSPVTLGGVYVTDNSMSANGRLELMSLYDEEGEIRGDFRGKNDVTGRGFVLGRMIGTLHLEDLLRITEELDAISADTPIGKKLIGKIDRTILKAASRKIFSLKKGA